MTHLTREQLIAWRDRPADVPRESVMAHLGSCRPCAAAYAELIRTAPAGEPVRFNPADFVQRGYAARASVAPRRVLYPNWRIWSAGLAAAAAVILVVTLAGPFGHDAGTEVRGTQIELAAPAAAARPLTFHWRSGLVAPQFTFSITDAVGAEVFRTRTNTTSVAVPGSASSRLQAGQTYKWTVTALDEDGKSITSATSTFVAAAPRR